MQDYAFSGKGYLRVDGEWFAPPSPAEPFADILAAPDCAHL